MPHFTPLQIAQSRWDNETPFEVDDVPRCAACGIGEMILRKNQDEICSNCGHKKETEQEPEWFYYNRLLK